MIDFKLPENLIAQEPARPRDHARLLIYNRKNKTITDDYFYNLINYLPKNTTVVVNNSKVEHCRLLFNDAKLEIFVLESVNNKTVRALIRPGKKFKLNDEVNLTENLKVTVTAIDADGIRTLQFNQTLDHPDVLSARHVPLPPYIAQNDQLALEYQTIYAKTSGSKAAPTAGLHFTPKLKSKVKKNFGWEEVTLHVGLGTFLPLTDEQLASGRLHEEWYEIDENSAKKISQAKHITAVGTTSVRTLESAWNKNKLSTGTFQTDILISPGYQFKRVNSLITNFHLPGTSLLLLVEAFVGSEKELDRIYNHAIKNQYRFYSFGDAMLVV